MKAVSLEKAEVRKCGKSLCNRHQVEAFCSRHRREPTMKYYKDKNIVPRSNPIAAKKKEQAS